MTKVGKKKSWFLSFILLDLFVSNFIICNFLSPYSFSVINSSQYPLHFHNIPHKTQCAPSDYAGLVLIIL